MELSVVHGLKQGNEVLKEIHKELNVESVERLLEETQEAREYQRVSSSQPSATSEPKSGQEIGDMLSTNLTLDEEDAVQAELRELQADVVSAISFTLSLLIIPVIRRPKHPLLWSCPQSQTRNPFPKCSWKMRNGQRSLSPRSARVIQDIKGSVYIETIIYHPSKFPNPSFLFFLSSSGPVVPTSTWARFKYFPTAPLVGPVELISAPTLTPNQFMLSFSFFSIESVGFDWSAWARFASLLARRFL